MRHPKRNRAGRGRRFAPRTKDDRQHRERREAIAAIPKRPSTSPAVVVVVPLPPSTA